jgi:hypothetical protein
MVIGVQLTLTIVKQEYHAAMVIIAQLATIVLTLPITIAKRLALLNQIIMTVI